MIGAAVVACTLALAPGVDTPDSAAMVLERASYHVRSTDERAQAWIQAGAVGSQTFRDLLNRLSNSDLIVYVQIVDRLNGAFGHSYFVNATETGRYIRTVVVPSWNFNERVARVGHEPQHAVEIAGAPRIRDRQTLAQFYLGMGENALSSGQYDSAEARVTEARVKRELIGSSAFRSSSADRLHTRFKNE